MPVSETAQNLFNLWLGATAEQRLEFAAMQAGYESKPAPKVQAGKKGTRAPRKKAASQAATAPE